MTLARLWSPPFLPCWGPELLHHAAPTLVARLALPSVVLWMSSQPVSGHSALPCQFASSWGGILLTCSGRPSSSSPSGRVLVPCVGLATLAHHTSPCSLLPPLPACACKLCCPPGFGLKLRKEQQARRDTRGRGPEICFKKLRGDLCTCAKVCMRP